MVDINPVVTTGTVTNALSEPKGRSLSGAKAPDAALTANDLERTKSTAVARESLENSVNQVEALVKAITKDTSLSFRVEDDLSRMVVTVRAVGSDEIIRQFPPEEFITVAKHIAAQNPDLIDEDYLKGILFDQRI
jgi:uncharacterized FlaG/YvyC family protein